MSPSMRVVWKWQLDLVESQSVSMPEDARSLGVQMQHDTLALWALVDPTRDVDPRVVRIIGTGNEAHVSFFDGFDYAGTVQMPPGRVLVWHVFVQQPRSERLRNAGSQE